MAEEARKTGVKRFSMLVGCPREKLREYVYIQQALCWWPVSKLIDGMRVTHW
jgi:hypothetical protein